AENYVEVMARKASEAAPSVTTKRDDLPAELAALIDDCLALDPAKRPASMHVFLARLDEVLRGLPRASRSGGEGAAAAPLAPAPSTSAHTDAGVTSSGGRLGVVGWAIAGSVLALALA